MNIVPAKVRGYYLLLPLLVFGGLLSSSIRAQTAPGASALCDAIRHQQWGEALRLVESGVIVTNPNNEGRTPLGMLVNRWFGKEEDYLLRRKLLDLLVERG